MNTDKDGPFTTQLAPQQRRSREARDRIMAGAEALLRAEGVEGFSMAGVGKAAGLPVGNIYRRFEGRETLLNALKEVVASRIRDAVMRSVREGRHEDLAGFVNSFAQAMGQAFSRDEALHRALFDPRIASPHMLETGRLTKSTNYYVFREGVGHHLPHLSEDRLSAAAAVGFSIIVNAALQKVRGLDPVLADIGWAEVISEFGAAATGYLEALSQTSSNRATPT